MQQISPTGVTTAQFRLSVLEPLVSREMLHRGELESIIHNLAQHEYTIPNSDRRHINGKTIQSWYYAWRRNGVAGLIPRVRIDRGKSKLSPEIQAAIIKVKQDNPKRSILDIVELISANKQFESENISKSTVHRLLQFQGLSRKISSFDEQLENHFAVFNECFKNASSKYSSKESMLVAFRWMLKILQYQYSSSDLQGELGDRITKVEIDELIHHIRYDALPGRNRAIIVLARMKHIPNTEIGDFLGIAPAVVSGLFRRYTSEGLLGLYGPRKAIPKKSEDQKCKEAVFALLHSPPMDHDVNRTSWTLKTLSEVSSRNGFLIGKNTISKITKDAGFRFRKAKKVLTSTDPQYREKLQEITNILANLKSNEKFFSVDEYGPFSIKMQGGISLVKADEIRAIPQYQKTKGSLIVTAALELSENKMTHFYSKNKNTEEMLKLLEVLIQEYSDQSRIYFSWDAASWHVSKKLYSRIAEINSEEYRETHRTPLVTLAPLPRSAQFLNVIESVFSGMARAIIHNSDYRSVEECQSAIDRYFSDRNAHFKAFPSRAGNKIWGKERVPSTFSESSNCKDPLYR